MLAGGIQGGRGLGPRRTPGSGRPPSAPGAGSAGSSPRSRQCPFAFLSAEKGQGVPPGRSGPHCGPSGCTDGEASRSLRPRRSPIAPVWGCRIQGDVPKEMEASLHSSKAAKIPPPTEKHAAFADSDLNDSRRSALSHTEGGLDTRRPGSLPSLGTGLPGWTGDRSQALSPSAAKACCTAGRLAIRF